MWPAQPELAGLLGAMQRPSVLVTLSGVDLENELYGWDRFQLNLNF